MVAKEKNMVVKDVIATSNQARDKIEIAKKKQKGNRNKFEWR